MTELLRAPTEGYAEAIVVPLILVEQFDLKYSLINMMTPDQFFRLEKDNPHDHIRWFNKITSTIKYKDVPNSAIKLMLFPFSLAGAARRTTNLRNEISNFQQRFDESFHEAWDRYKNLLRACPHHGFTELHQLDTFYNALNPAGQDSLNSAAGGNLLERPFVKAVEKIYVTCGGAHPYYLCLAADGNTFPELRDDIQGYVAVAAVNYNQGSGHLPSNTIANPKGELKAITTRSGIVLDGPSVPIPPTFINPEEDERVEETLTDQDLAGYTIKVPPLFVQKSKPHSQRNFVVHQRDPLHPNIPYPSRMLKQKQQEKDKKMLKFLLSNKEKLLELANTPLNENCSAVILKKLPEKLGDPGKFLISFGFSELKCKALANLGASINLMPLFVWKKLGLPELISTRMTLELANRAICTPPEIVRDVFISVGKFTFPADFVIVDYESDPRFPLILGRPFLRTARALIDIHREKMILCDGDERLTSNMRHDTSSYPNQPPKESINMINIFNYLSEDFLEDLFATNHQSGNLTFSPRPNLTSPEVKDDVFDPEGGNVLIEKLLDLNSTKDLHPTPHNVNPLSGSTTSSSSLNHLLEEFAEYLLNHDPIKDMDSILKDSVDQSNLADLNDNLADTMPEMLTKEHALDYSSPLLYDEYDDDIFKVESDTEYVYIDPFDSKGEKIKESKLLIDELDLPSDVIPSFEYDSFLFEYFSEVDDLPSTNNEDKVFNLGILIQENLFEVITCIAPDKNIKKLDISHASLILEDLILLSMNFLSSEKFLELSHQGYKVFKIIKILKSPMEIFLFSHGEDIRILNSQILKTHAGFCPSAFTSSASFGNHCQDYGTVVDVYIPNRKSKAGKRFAFVHFIKVENIDRLAGNLCTLWIGRMHLHANVVRFKRSPIQASHSASSAKPNHIGASSFATVLKGNNTPVNASEAPAMVIDDSCVVTRDLEFFVMGEVKKFSSIPNLRVLLSNESFQNVKVVYLGGLWVMFELESLKPKEKFMQHVGVASWFTCLCNVMTLSFPSHGTSRHTKYKEENKTRKNLREEIKTKKMY
uniref:Reverse transcriptase domain-containing protein n=1 Tax=Tanacetum cinerariifolium TaxID=118510 RepID=A0A6L2KWM9_TANCI|nr:reverse transcriptase domain-containing protein [Tanacetum cinerariifolium]